MDITAPEARVEALRAARKFVRDAEREAIKEGDTELMSAWAEVDWTLDLLQSELQLEALKERLPSPASVITRHFCNVQNLPEGLQTAALGARMSGIGESAVLALEEAGYKIVEA